ncbi:MAG: ABC transporter ATP-binding protein [Ancalomicrobiaceae bacterium]|nr:ABC transporter ATP-binding protein [Ancalomicrobiaceae bacterium]
MSAPPQISFRSVAKRYGATLALKSVSLDIAQGEFLALVGPSGCGKSTLLRILAGLESLDDGRISIAGQDVTARRAADRDVAMVFQSYALYPHLTARQNMAVPLVMRRMNAWQRLPFVGPMMPGRRAVDAKIADKVGSVADSLKIAALLDRKPGQMSGGQRQRVALGRAIVREPKAFLMDEPLSNLDAALRVHTRSEIVDLHRRLGATTVYVTHDQEEALSMADRVAVMKEGRLLQVATPRAIYDDPDHIEVAEFIGSPKINLAAADVGSDGVARLGPTVIADGLGDFHGSVLRVGFRPEHGRIGPQERPGDGEVAVSFSLTRLEFLGAGAIAHGTLATGESVELRVGHDFVPPADSRVFQLVLPIRQLMLFAPSGDRLRTGTSLAAPHAAEAMHG